MKHLWIVAVVWVTVTLNAGGVYAGPIVGTNVTGSVTFAAKTVNAFDPVNKKVPAGFLNKNGLTVTISASQAEFGFKDNINSFSADFTDTQLIINATLTTSNSFIMTFKNDAFLGATLLKINDTFISAGVVGTTIGSLDGTTLVVTWPGTKGTLLDSKQVTAIYEFNFPAPSIPDPPAPAPTVEAATVPEPACLTLFAFMGAMYAAALQYSRRSR